MRRRLVFLWAQEAVTEFKTSTKEGSCQQTNRILYFQLEKIIFNIFQKKQNATWGFQNVHSWGCCKVFAFSDEKHSPMPSNLWVVHPKGLRLLKDHFLSMYCSPWIKFTNFCREFWRKSSALASAFALFIPPVCSDQWAQPWMLERLLKPAIGPVNAIVCPMTIGAVVGV